MTDSSSLIHVIEKVRPYIQSDGGDITLVGVHEDTGIVEVSLHGACGSCPSSLSGTLMAIENMIREEIDPESRQNGFRRGPRARQGAIQDDSVH